MYSLRIRRVRPHPPRPLSRLANGWIVRIYDIGGAAAEGVVPTRRGWRTVWWKADGTVLHPPNHHSLTIVSGSNKPWTRREEVDWSKLDRTIYIVEKP